MTLLQQEIETGEIGLCAYTFYRGKKTGIERYSDSLIKAYANLGYAFPLFSGDTPQETELNNRHHKLPGRKSLFLKSILGMKMQPPGREKLRGLHFLQPMPMRYTGPHVVTIHDFAPLITPAAYPAYTPRMFRYTIQLLIDQGASFICNSENTRNDFHRFFRVSEERVEVTYLGISPNFRPPADQNSIRNLKAKYQLPDDYFLFIGSMNKRKNLDNLLEAFKKICVDCPSTDLVLAGNMEWGGDEVRQKVRRLDLESRVHFPGYIAEADLPDLIHFSRGLVYLSKYEGFGFPVLEGMACGTPVICSPASALPEVGGDAVLYADPDNVTEIAMAMQLLVSNPSLGAELAGKGLARARNFSWEKTARETLEIYQRNFG